MRLYYAAADQMLCLSTCRISKIIEFAKSA